MQQLNQKGGMACSVMILAAAAIVVGLILLFNLGSSMSGDVSYTSVLVVMAIIFAIIIYAGKRVSQKNPEEAQIIEDRKTALNTLTEKCNYTTDLLQECYIRDTDNETKNVKETKSHYDKLYQENVQQYKQECDTLKKEWAQKPQLKTNKFWNWALGLGLLGGCAGSSFSVGLNMPPETEINALMDSRTWSAENIPMPHMDDHSLYVSNPDSILSQAAVDTINATMERLDDILGVESAVVIVGHIQDDDPVAMVRGIYDKYKVGRNDRGLVIVVGYLDHSYFIAPGRSLEGDLTDYECNHLAQDYLIPSMKAEMPDSGMVYLARGVYSLIAGKEMPQMSALTSSSDDDGGGGLLSLVLSLALFLGFGIYAGNKSSQTVAKSTVPLKSNPFYTPPVISGGHIGGGGGGGRHSSWGGGGSSHRPGGYGGGSWGGGGSGGRW